MTIEDGSASSVRRAPRPKTFSSPSDDIPEDRSLTEEPESGNAAIRAVSSATRTTPVMPLRAKPDAGGSTQFKGGVVSTPKEKPSSTVGATPFCNAAPIPPPMAAPPSFFDNLKLELDAASMILFVTALSTRFYKLDEPRAVVFDELNFGRFASHYLRRVFYFDVHPPLGKMLIAAAASYGVSSYNRNNVVGGGGSGNDGADEGFDFAFETIGADIPASVPLWHLRFVPAFCGSLLAPLSYHLLLEIGCSSWTASLGALLVILDNALLVQSHFILLEPILLCAVALSFISLLKFVKSPKPFSSPLSVFWLISLGIFLGVAISVKYNAVYAWLMCGIAVSVNFWHRQLPDASISWRALIFRALLCSGAVYALPIAIYCGVFGAHVLWLHKAGPHDHVMTSAFQASLDGGLSSIIKGQPPFIKIGSQITLRHTYGQPPCWLHSHEQLYPLKYPDGRGSSYQQQVTCYSFKDVNNWWIVKDPNADTIPEEPEEARTVQHGDVIQLLHGVTGRSLNSHDVAAPLSPEYQEVSCYIDYNVSMPAQNLWRVEIIGGAGKGRANGASGVDARWRTILSHVRLVHVNTGQALKSTQKALPDWGSHQIEVATERVTSIEQTGTLWNVEEHKAPAKVADAESESKTDHNEDAATKKKAEFERETSNVDDDATIFGEVMPLKKKMVELQIKMVTTFHDIPQEPYSNGGSSQNRYGQSRIEHRYGSTPNEWPLLDTTVGYWVSGDSHSQIHLVGNPIIWRTGVIATALYLVLLTIYLLLFHRGWMTHPDHIYRPRSDSISREEDSEGDESVDAVQNPPPPDSSAASSSSSHWWSTFQRGGWLLIGGYLLHYIPYFVYDHTLFLHHYIPALYFKILTLAFVVDHVGSSFICGRARVLQHALALAVVVWLVVVVLTFKMLAPLSYGDPDLTADQLKGLQMNDNWDFVFH